MLTTDFILIFTHIFLTSVVLVFNEMVLVLVLNKMVLVLVIVIDSLVAIEHEHEHRHPTEHEHEFLRIENRLNSHEFTIKSRE